MWLLASTDSLSYSHSHSKFSLQFPFLLSPHQHSTMPPASATFSVLLLLTILAAPGASAAWCVCKDGLSDAAMQKTLDYACGAGADCNPIHSSGHCYNPNTIKSHCSYAVNSYYQRKGASGATCDFSGTAHIVSSDPSVSSSCTFPASSSAAGTTTTPTTNSPPSSRTPTTTTPYSSIGGVSTGLGPSGANTDFSKANPVLLNTILISSLAPISGLVLLLWG